MFNLKALVFDLNEDKIIEVVFTQCTIDLIEKTFVFDKTEVCFNLCSRIEISKASIDFDENLILCGLIFTDQIQEVFLNKKCTIFLNDDKYFYTFINFKNYQFNNKDLLSVNSAKKIFCQKVPIVLKPEDLKNEGLHVIDVNALQQNA